MKKVLLFVVVLTLLSISFQSTSAQAPNSPAACKPDELKLALDAVGIYSDTTNNLMKQYDLSGDPKAAAYGATVVALDAVSYAFWSKVQPALPKCAESQLIAYVVGTIFDEYLTIGLLNNLGAWSDAGKLGVDVAVLKDHATKRQKTLTDTIAALNKAPLADFVKVMSGDNLPACTADQVKTLGDGAGSAMKSLGDLVMKLADKPELAFAATEGAAFTFDTEVFSKVATCKENLSLALYTSHTLNQLNIITGLYANAVSEADAAKDVAKALSDSAQLRLKDFQASMTAMVATPAATPAK